MPPKKKGNNARRRKETFRLNLDSDEEEARELQVRDWMEDSRRNYKFGITTKQAAAKVPKLTEF